MRKKIAALYGAGNKSLQAENVLRRHAPEVTVAYLVEGKQLDKVGQEMSPVGGGAPLRVISRADVARLYAVGECDMVVVPMAYHLFDLREIRENLKEAGIAAQDIYYVPHNRLRAPLERRGPGLEPLVPFDEAAFIFHLDVHVVDHCNLHCKACAHFSNCVDGEVVYDADLLRRSLEHLQGIIPNIPILALLGGEPLLHPRLDEIIIAARDTYPYARILLTTNGILLDQISPAVLEMVREKEIVLSISLTPPLFNKTDSLKAFLKGWGMQYRINKIDFFERRLTPTPQFDARKQFAKCGHIMCLRGSRIGYCVNALFTDYYNRHFASCGVMPLPEDQGVDIFAHESGPSLLAALQQPLELCSRCVSRDAGDLFWEKWEHGAKPMFDDWFVNGLSVANAHAAVGKEGV